MPLDIQGAIDGAQTQQPVGGSPPPAPGTPIGASQAQPLGGASESGLNTGGPSSAAASSAAPAIDAGQGGGSAAAAQTAWSLREELRAAGIDPSAYQDDRSAWQAVQSRLAAQHQSYERANQIASYYLANQQKIQAALAAANQTQQPAAQEESWWKAPGWNTEDERFLEFHEGMPRLAPWAVGFADPSLPGKYIQAKQWQQQTLQKLTADPIGTLKPGLEKLIEEKASELIQKQLGTYRDQTNAQNYVASQPWMVQRDASGQAVSDQYGRPVLSAAGRRFGEYVQWLDGNGIRDVNTQKLLAEQLVQAESLRGMYAQAAANNGVFPGFGQHQPVNAQAANAAAKANALNGAGARHIPAAGAATQLPNQVVQPRNKLPLRERLAKAFADNGVVPGM